MMNQVDSRCFDDNKRWWQKAQKNDFKNESTIQESREVNDFKIESTTQELREVWFQDSRKDIKKNQDSREEIKKQQVKTSQGKYWKGFFKNQT